MEVVLPKASGVLEDVPQRSLLPGYKSVEALASSALLLVVERSPGPLVPVLHSLGWAPSWDGLRVSLGTPLVGCFEHTVF